MNLSALSDDELRQMYQSPVASMSDEQLRAAYKAPKAEAEDPGAIMAGVIGSGRVLDQAYKGVKQLGLSMFGKHDELAKMKQEEDENTRIYAGLQEKRPIATTIGEIAPLMAALPAVGGIGSAAALNALPGAISYGTAEDRATRAGIGAAGGAAGAGLGKLLGRAVQPFRPQPSQSQLGAQAAAERIGLNLRPGEIVQSKPLQWAESSLNDMPFAGGMAQKTEAARREAINMAGARAIGKTAPEITEDVLASARTDIGNTFDTLLQGRKITLDDSFRAEAKAITSSKVMKSLRDEGTEAVIAPFQNMPAGKIQVTGEWFQQNKTALDAAVRGAYTAGENGKAKSLEQFEKALERAAVRSMAPEEAAAFKVAQKQWASLRLLETGKVVEGGNIMPGRLDTAMTSRYKGAYKEGKIKGELADIGKIAQTYKPLAQSGTTPRALYSMLLAGNLGPAGLAVPAAVQKFIQSDAGRKYLTQGLLDVSPEMERRLMQGGMGLLGTPAAAAIN